MAKKDPQRRAQTKQRIAAAFWELYEVMPLEKVTVRAIVDRAECNRSTFYEYFNNPSDVLEHIETKLIVFIGQQVGAHLTSKRQPLGFSEGATVNGNRDESNGRGRGPDNPLSLITSIYVDNKRYLSMLLGSNGDPAFARRLKERLAPVIAAAFGAQLDRQTNEYALEFALSGALSVMTLWYERSCEETPEEMAQIVYALLSRGPMSELLESER